MKHLVVVAHPAEESLTKGLARTYAARQQALACTACSRMVALGMLFPDLKANI